VAAVAAVDIWAGDLPTGVLAAVVVAVTIMEARMAALLKTVLAAAMHLMKDKQDSQQHVVGTVVQIQVVVQVVDSTAQTAVLAL
jgi:hypothetical protein